MTLKIRCSLSLKNSRPAPAEVVHDPENLVVP